MIMLRGSRGERFDVTTFPRRGWYSALEDANLAIDCERVGVRDVKFYNILLLFLLGEIFFFVLTLVVSI